MNIGVIIQARMGSTRLPGKVMMELQGKSVLSHVIDRLKQSRLLNTIIVATTDKEEDSIIAKEALGNGAKVFRGSEQNVLSRYYFAAKENNLDVIVRVTSDCPLIDSKILDDLLGFYLSNHYDIVSNAGPELTQRTYPRGLDVEIFTFEVLEMTFINATQLYQKEHVTPYIYESSNRVYIYKNEFNYSNHRWTLDTKEDFRLISEIYANLYHGKHDFYMSDILNLFRKNPDLMLLNEHIEQKKLDK